MALPEYNDIFIGALNAYLTGILLYFTVYCCILTYLTGLSTEGTLVLPVERGEVACAMTNTIVM